MEHLDKKQIKKVFYNISEVIFPSEQNDASSSFFYQYNGSLGYAQSIPKKAGNLRILALDEKYLTLRSGFREFTNNYFFLSSKKKQAKQINKEEYLLYHMIIMLVLMACVYLIKYKTTRTGYWIVAAIALTFALGAFPYYEIESIFFSGKAAHYAFYSNAGKILLILLMAVFLVLFVARIIDLTWDKINVILIVIVPLCSLAYLFISTLFESSFLYYSQYQTIELILFQSPGWSFQFILATYIAYVSYRFFSFKFKFS